MTVTFGGNGIRMDEGAPEFKQRPGNAASADVTHNHRRQSVKAQPGTVGLQGRRDHIGQMDGPCCCAHKMLS